MTSRIRCPECNAQEEEHCSTCGGTGFPTVKEVVMASTKKGVELERERILSELRKMYSYEFYSEVDSKSLLRNITLLVEKPVKSKEFFK